ncbi:GNAT family N-acetyltransferase [Streptomyces sp. NPDC005498]|uniref:GNAT family N-acetyltransferase n=1 Tax=Streptomyces sp. NPDC005498 TaxID=3364717 RepID=UPI0036A75A75
MYVTHSAQEIEAAVHAWGEALRAMATAEPRMRQYNGEHDTHVVFTGSLADSTNGVFSFGRSARAGEIARMADRAARMAGSFPVPPPWCVQVRSRPDERVRTTARRHGLTLESWEPFLIRGLRTAPPAAPGGGRMTVRAVTGAEHELYVRALAAGFTAPEDLFRVLVTPAVMDAPGITAFVGEVEDRPVATALGVVTDGHVGVFHVSTAPEHRRQGYGARITEEVVTRGREAGATTAYLRSSDMALSMYKSLGFGVAEHWTYLTAP